MKKILIALLLGNVIVFGWFQSGRLGEQPHQEQPPLQEEKIRVQDPMKTEVLHEKALPELTSADISTAPSSDLKLSMKMSVPPVQKEMLQHCLEWGDFSGPDLDRSSQVLAGLQLVNNITKRIVEHDTGFWVFIPPLKNKSAVNKKVGELRDLGIRDYFVVSSAGRWRNAISLGVFKTREAAQNLLTQLRTKGVRSATIGERASKIKTTRYILSGINTETKLKLVELQKDFSGSEMVNVQCALTR